MSDQEKLPYTAEEVKDLQAFIGTPGGQTLIAWVKQAHDIARTRCELVTADHRFHQGIAAGIAQIEKLLDSAKNFKVPDPKQGNGSSVGWGSWSSTATVPPAVSEL